MINKTYIIIKHFIHSRKIYDNTFQDYIWKIGITLLDIKSRKHIPDYTPKYLLCFICSLPLSPIIFHLSCWHHPHHPLYLKIPRESIHSQRFFATLFNLKIKLQNLEYSISWTSNWNSLFSYSMARCSFIQIYMINSFRDLYTWQLKEIKTLEMIKVIIFQQHEILSTNISRYQ